MFKRFFCTLLCITLMSTAAVPWHAFAEEEENEEQIALDYGKKDDETPRDLTDDDLYNQDNAPDDTEITEAEEASGLFSDITDEKILRYAEILVTLGFFQGYEDGTFKPEREMTRSEFMAVLMRTLDVSENDAGVPGYKFYDVIEGSREYNIMSYAVEHNFYNVFNDNTVRPNDPIKYEDAIIAYLKAMNYEIFAEAEGGYTTGYKNIASRLRLDKGVTISGNLTRGEAVRLIYNCVNAPISKLVGYGSSMGFSNDDNETILSKYHDVYYAKGIINAVSISGTGDYQKAGNEKIVIDGKSYTDKGNKYISYLGYEVEYFYRDIDDIREIVLIQKNDRIKEITVMSDDIIGYRDGKFEYRDENGRKKSVKIDQNHTLIKNGKYCDDYTENDFMPSSGYVKLTANDGSKYDLVYVYEYYNAVAKSVSAMGNVMYITFDYDVNALQLDISDENLIVEMYTDKNKMDVSIGVETYYDGDGNKQTKTRLPKIPAGSLVSIFADSFEMVNGRRSISDSAQYIRIEINTPSVTGTVHATSDENITIGKNEYNVADSNYLNATNQILKPGIKGKFLLDYAGNVAAWVPAAGTDEYVYGYLIDVLRDEDNDGYIAKILTASGKIIKYNADAKTRINDIKPKNSAEAMAKLAASAQMLNTSDLHSQQIIKYVADENNTLTKIMTVTAPKGTADGYDKEQWLSRYNTREEIVCRTSMNYTFMHKAPTNLVTKLGEGGSIAPATQWMTFCAGKPDVIFVVPNAYSADNEDYYVKSNGWDYGDSTTGARTAELYNVDKNLSPEAAVVYDNGKEEKCLASPLLVVDKLYQSLNDDDEVVWKVSGYSGGTKKEYESENINTLAGVKKGDVVILNGKTVGAKEIVTAVEKITSIADIANENYGNPEINRYTAASKLNNVSTYFSMYEAYSANIAKKTVVLQRGADVDNGARAVQRTTYIFDNNASLHYGLTLATYSDGNKIELSSTSISAVKGAQSFSHTKSSKILIAENSDINLRYMLIVNVE